MRNDLIKYRQWNKAANKFHYWGYQNDETFNGPLNHKDKDVMESERFTGYLDYNGVEIYEGDITRELTTRYNPIIDGEVIIRYRKKNEIVKRCKFIGEWDGVKALPSNGYDFNYVEVIGNIYQNSEMLRDII